MTRPIQVLTLREFEEVLDAWTPVRKIDSVHIHCTDRPRHADFRGLATIEAMRRYHQSIGMSDIAQHLTVDPGGLLWTGRPFDAMPASVRGHNGSGKAGPFMIEMVGLFEGRDQVAADPFGGDQKAAVQAAVCAILRQCELDEKAVKFHREFPKTGKTCPGKNLDPVQFRAEIRAALAGDTLRNVETRVPRGLARAPLDRAALLTREVPETPAYLEVPEDAASLHEQEILASWFERGLLDPSVAGSRGAVEEFSSLVPHIVNTSQGVLSNQGKAWTTTTDIRNLIDRHLTPAFDSGKFQHLLFYAHGGLNSEKGSLEYARVMVPWWCSYGVYPIYFIWESSLFQAIFEQPRAVGRGTERGIGDFFDRIAEAATQKLARKIWARMKANARRCSAPTTEFGRPGGLFEFWNLLAPWLAGRKGEIGLHAIGHSTGPILLSSFMPLLTRSAARHEFDSLTYLAPAIRTDDFARDVQPDIGPAGPIRQLRVFTMNDEAERNDTVAKIYRKSLLYYVREACEDHTDGRILGLEKDLYADPSLRALFGLKATAGDLRSPLPADAAAPAVVEFAQDDDAAQKNDLTQATQHGFFDNDPVTMRTVLARILGRTDLDGFAGGRRFPTREEFERGEALDDVADRALAESEPVGEECCCCRCHADRGQGAGGAGEFDAEPGGPSTPPASPAGGSGGSGGGKRGRRIALCVGIDAYPRQPLSGCVQDSENWAAALAAAGFDVRKLRNQDATRAGLQTALRTLLRDGQPGDQLVFQFAGHGSQVEDLSNDEQDGFDEVVVPVDFDTGALWIDDDLYELCRELRSGARLTFFMDCCHSGTNARFAPKLAAARGAARPRYLPLDARDVAAYQRSRKVSRGLPPVSERTPLAGVVKFAACRDREVAWEEQGQGNFSRHAIAVFGRILAAGGSNRDFLAAVERQFGADQRQHPVLDRAAGDLEQAPFLGGR